jgi:ferritin-like metal-binding protein YciE
MASRTLEDQLVKYLTDVHAIEQQALVQMRVAPKLAGEASISSAFARHLTETEEHERLVRECLEARGERRNTAKDVIAAIIGQGFGAFAAAQPDTPGKLVAHAYSYEHMEEAAYALLGLLAERLADSDVLDVARRIERQEQEMAGRLEELFDPAVDASLGALEPSDLAAQLDKYLADAHGIEQQAIALLRRSPKLAGAGELAAAYEEHLDETIRHAQLIDTRLHARGAKSNVLKDAALRLGAFNWGAFFAAQPDTPAKLAGFAYAFEHLEIASYELLRRVAQRAGDTETAEVAGLILGEERAAADKLRSMFAQALDGSLRELSLPAR